MYLRSQYQRVAAVNMKFHSYVFQVDVDVEPSVRNAVFKGIIGTWLSCPDKRRLVLESKEFSAVYHDIGLDTGHYVLESSELLDLFFCFKKEGQMAFSGLSSEETEKDMDEQQRVYDLLRRTVKKNWPEAYSKRLAAEIAARRQAASM